MIYYKIRSKSNAELFLMGTPTYHYYNTKGRVFQSLGQLRTFITGIMKYRNGDLGEWDIIEYELKEISVKGVHEIITPKKLLEILAK